MKPETRSRLRPYLPLLCLLIGIGTLMAVYYPPTVGHWYLDEESFPNQYVPAVAGYGGSFSVSPKIEALWIDGNEAKIEKGVISVQGLSVGWHEVKVRINGREENRGKALYVAPFNQENFIFAVTSDIHVPRFGKVMREIVENGFKLVNEIGPAFAFAAGDLVDYSLDIEWKYYLDLKKRVEMPFYQLPGNHDTYSDPKLKKFIKHLGPTDYSFKFGDVLFVCTTLVQPYGRAWGGLTGNQLEWLDNRLSPPASLKFLINHLPVAYGKTTIYQNFPIINRGSYHSCVYYRHEKLMQLLKRENVVSIFGHWHVFDEPFVYDNLLFYHNPSLTPNSTGGLIQWALGGGMMMAGHSFYIFQVENGRISYAKPVDIYKLRIERIEKENCVEVKVKNDHPYPVPLNLEFKLGAGMYKSTAGEVFYPGGDRCWIRYLAPENCESSFTVTVGR
jgi:hypothetical protein